MNVRLHTRLRELLRSATTLQESIPAYLHGLPVSHLYAHSLSYRRMKTITEEISEVIVAALHDAGDDDDTRGIEDASLLAVQALTLVASHGITPEDDEDTASDNELNIAKIGSLLRAIDRWAAGLSPSGHTAV